MPNKPAEHLQAVTWRLDRELLAAVREAAWQQGVASVAFVARALRRELDATQPLAVIAKAAADRPPSPAPDWMVHHYDEID